MVSMMFCEVVTLLIDMDVIERSSEPPVRFLGSQGPDFCQGSWLVAIL